MQCKFRELVGSDDLGTRKIGSGSKVDRERDYRRSVGRKSRRNIGNYSVRIIRRVC